MYMPIENIIEMFLSKIKPGVSPGLSRIENVLNSIGNPQLDLNFVHVAGTNGKGSVCSMIASVLIESGYKTGLYTSPFVTEFRERIKINDQMIPAECLYKTVKGLLPYAENLTEFEFITAVALKWFKENKCDIVVLEVGLGGRLDATNIIDNPLVSVITSISLDHTHILGDTVQDIAYEKCGIIKNRCTTVLYPEQDPSVKDIVRREVNRRRGDLITPELSEVREVKCGLTGSTFSYKGNKINLNLPGRHQIKNCVTAIEVIDVLRSKGLNITKRDLEMGIKKTFIPARFEVVSTTPTIILDGAHNVDGAFALAQSIKGLLDNKKLVGIFGVLKDKNYKSMTKLLAPLFDCIITVSIKNERTLSCEDLKREVEKYCKSVYCEENVAGAVKRAFDVMDNQSTLIVFGSLYLISEFKNYLSD